MAFEVGIYSPWVARLFSSLDHRVIVANARKLQLISQNDQKDDRLDSELLARLGRVDPELLSPIQHRSEEMQQDLSYLKARQLLVRNRTRCVNHVRMAAKTAGQKLASGISTRNFHRIAREGVLSHPAIAELLDEIGQLNKRIKFYDGQIEKLCRDKYPETEILRQIRGVGAQTALCFVLKIQRVERFARSRDVGPYFGLSPRRRQSGQRDPQLRITKAGDRLMRALLIQAAHYILGPFGVDSDLRRHGERISARGGANARKRAVVAVARKVAVVMHHLWASGLVYEPLHNAEKLEAA